LNEKITIQTIFGATLMTIGAILIAMVK
jgi:uncharacterized membrane protein